jgi:hypothetical protein
MRHYIILKPLKLRLRINLKRKSNVCGPIAGENTPSILVLDVVLASAEIESKEVVLGSE